MMLDESKIFTAVNATKVTIGSKGYFANTLSSLENAVLLNKSRLSEIKSFLSSTEEHRFVNECGENYALFYLVKKAKRKMYRPYKDANEMVADFLERYNAFSGNANAENPMYKPLIWVRDKLSRQEYLIVSFNSNKIVLVDNPTAAKTQKFPFDMKFLIGAFDYLDGSPCGKLLDDDERRELGVEESDGVFENA